MDIHNLICLSYLIVIIAIMIFCGLMFCPILLKVLTVAFVFLSIVFVFEFIRRFIKDQSESYDIYADEDDELQ